MSALDCSAIYKKEDEIISHLIACHGGCVQESEVGGNLRLLILAVLFRFVNSWPSNAAALALVRSETILVE
jgi:hypothetical protein